MSEDRRWITADESALTWIRSIALNDRGVGFLVGPMPDQVYVLHPIFERVDGKPVQVPSIDGTDYEDQPDELEAPLRRVTWAEHARRCGVPMLRAGEFPTWNTRFARTFHVTDRGQAMWGPEEGSIDDVPTQRALFEVLTRHTAGGDDALCTAFHWAIGPSQTDSNLRRGPLAAWPHLYDSDDAYSPQNIWPDSREWVLSTDPDALVTVISGSTSLIEDLIRSPQLEVVRPPQDA